jgi:hypothetical protein
MAQISSRAGTLGRSRNWISPARTLHRREGFEEAGEVAPGLQVVRFEKAADEL